MSIGPHLIRLEAETYSLKEILDVLLGMKMELNVKDLSAVGFFSMSDSPINLSLLFFKKQDGTMQLCTEFLLFDEVTMKDLFPLFGLVKFQMW